MIRLESLTGLRRSFKTCGTSNAHLLMDHKTTHHIFYDNEMPEVAVNDMEEEFETDFKKTMRTKNFNCMKFSQTKRLLRSHYLSRSH